MRHFSMHQFCMNMNQQLNLKLVLEIMEINLMISLVMRVVRQHHQQILSLMDHRIIFFHGNIPNLVYKWQVNGKIFHFD